MPTKKEYKDTLTYNEVRELVAQHPDWNIDVMTDIAFCESSFRTQVINNNPETKDYSVGLFQINLYGNLKNNRPSEEELKDPEKNVEWAHKIWTVQGYTAWTCYDKI